MVADVYLVLKNDEERKCRSLKMSTCELLSIFVVLTRELDISSLSCFRNICTTIHIDDFGRAIPFSISAYVNNGRTAM